MGVVGFHENDDVWVVVRVMMANTEEGWRCRWNYYRRGARWWSIFVEAAVHRRKKGNRNEGAAGL
jgi:hypothetical protein